jgi:hypothetical protein
MKVYIVMKETYYDCCPFEQVEEIFDSRDKAKKFIENFSVDNHDKKIMYEKSYDILPGDVYLWIEEKELL